MIINENIVECDTEMCVLNNFPSILRKLFNFFKSNSLVATLTPKFKKKNSINIKKVESIMDLHNYLIYL